MARVTLAAQTPSVTAPTPVDAPVDEPAIPASRRDIHVARRLRRRDALLGLGVLAATLGVTVGVLDMLH